MGRELFNAAFEDKQPLSNYAFALSTFVSKLYTAAVSDGITDLFFLAREGKYLKELFELYMRLIDKHSIQTHYLYVSRRSCVNATLKSLDEENFEAFSCYHALSLGIFLRALLFEPKDIANISNEIGTSESVEIKDFFSSEVWNRLKENKSFREKYDEIRFTQCHNFKLYLERAGFTNAKRPAVVDVGWRGTMQDRIFSLGLHPKLVGYYIGVYSNAVITSDCSKYGLLFDDNKGRNAFYYNNNYFEYLCVADHGSTVKYTVEGIPILKKDEDCAMYRKYFSTIQKNVLKKTSFICKAVPHPESVVELEHLFEQYHARMLLSFNKNEKEILRYALISHPDGLAEIKPQQNLRTIMSQIKKYLILMRRAFLCL